MQIGKCGFWFGVNVSRVVHIYEETPTKRWFAFYGINIGWLMIGVTVAKRLK